MCNVTRACGTCPAGQYGCFCEYTHGPWLADEGAIILSLALWFAVVAWFQVRQWKLWYTAWTGQEPHPYQPVRYSDGSLMPKPFHKGSRLKAGGLATLCLVIALALLIIRLKTADESDFTSGGRDITASAARNKAYSMFVGFLVAVLVLQVMELCWVAYVSREGCLRYAVYFWDGLLWFFMALWLGAWWEQRDDLYGHPHPLYDYYLAGLIVWAAVSLLLYGLRQFTTEHVQKRAILCLLPDVWPLTLLLVVLMRLPCE